jgi:hypothetical protein
MPKSKQLLVTHGRTATVGLVVVIAMMLLLGASAGAAVLNAAPVAPDRWLRGVCRHASDWLDARDASQNEISAISARLTAGDLTAKTGAKQLTEAYARAMKVSDAFVTQLRTEGVPKIAQGKRVATQLQQRATKYRVAYSNARRAIGRETTPDTATLAAAAQAINARVGADVAETGGDPIEDLRTVKELATGLPAACANVDEHLNATVATAGCAAALATARQYSSLLDQLATSAEGSPEEAALNDQETALFARWGAELGGCRNADVLGPCKPVLDTAQADFTAEATYQAAAPDSQEESKAFDDWYSLDNKLVAQLPKCHAT